MLKMKIRTKGGKNLRRVMQQARRGAGGVSGVAAGFLTPSATDRGMPVTNIAALNEFGARRGDGGAIPERPFMRKANATMRDDLVKVVKERVNPATHVVDGATAARVGVTMVDHIQKSIVETSSPENAPITRARKGDDNPLVDSGKMHDAVDYEIIQ